jgi:CRP-like cAMP-binding protein
MSDFATHRDGFTQPQVPAGFADDYCQHVRLAPRQPLFHEGDQPESFYRVKNGLIRLMRIKPDGRSVTLRHVLPGDLFGEEVFIGAGRFADAEAATEADVEVFDARELRGPNMIGVVHSLVTQTKRLLNDEYDFQVGFLRERIARYLCKLIRTPLAERAADGSWQICASHELIAEGTASTRESVSKELADMRHDGTIDTGYRCVSITDLKGLRRLGDPEGVLVG